MKQIKNLKVIARITDTSCILTVPQFLVKQMDIKHHEVLKISIEKVEEKEETDKDNGRDTL